MRTRRIPYLVCFLVVFPLVLLWSLATPVMAVVDDPAHVAAAAGAVRGEFHQPTINTINGRQQALKVPAKLGALAHVADCLIQSPDTLPTQCAKAPVAVHGTMVLPSTAIRYPPLFYWAIGWPTLIFSGLGAYWGVTVTAAILDSALLGLGLWAILNFGRRAVILAWMVCLTPEVLYLAGSANDSGFEISAAVAAWACLSALVRFERPPRPLLVTSTISIVCFVLARPASPVWTLLMLLTFGILAGWNRLGLYARQRSMRIAVASIATSFALAGAWRLYAGSPNLLYVAPPHKASLSEAVRAALFSVHGTLVSQVGVWLNTLVPLASLLLWLGAFSVLLVAGIALAPGRWLVAFGALLICVIAVPVLANVIQFNKTGLWWQGRDGIPFGIGLPVVLGAAVPNRLVAVPASRRLIICGVSAVGLLNAFAFLWILHRYAAGENGSWRPSAYVWEPPGGYLLLATLFLLSSAILCYSAWRWLTSSTTGPATRDPFDQDGSGTLGDFRRGQETVSSPPPAALIGE